MEEATHLNSDPIKEVADSISTDVELELQGDANTEK